MMITIHRPTSENTSPHSLTVKLDELIEIGKVQDNMVHFIIKNLDRIRNSLIPNRKLFGFPSHSVPKEYNTIPPLIIQDATNQNSKSLNILSAEKERIEKRLQGFQYKNSHAWKTLVQLYGDSVKRSTLCEIAKFVAGAKQLKMDRDAKRRKDVLVKWFEDNWSAIYPFIKYVRVENEIPFFSPNGIDSM